MVRLCVWAGRVLYCLGLAVLCGICSVQTERGSIIMSVNQTGEIIDLESTKKMLSLHTTGEE